VCRLFVPVYRQVSIVQGLGGLLINPDLGLGEMDVEQAFLAYWNTDNIDRVTHQHRPFIILGHSQGTWAASSLIAKHIETDPAKRAHLVSAILPGGDVQAPNAAPAGGGNDPNSTFQYLGACLRTSPGAPMPTGCVVAYSSYDLSAGTHPDPGANPGRSRAAGHHVLCTNPAALLAGTSPDAQLGLDAYLPTQQLLDGNPLMPNGQMSLLLIGWNFRNHPTGFTHYATQLQGQCESVDDSSGNASWLQVTGQTDLFPPLGSSSGLGLHVVDYNVALGDLVALAAAQSNAWLHLH
jgi:pimeloyl-ACP methyl ester carboxylesterase